MAVTLNFELSSNGSPVITNFIDPIWLSPNLLSKIDTTEHLPLGSNICPLLQSILNHCPDTLQARILDTNAGSKYVEVTPLLPSSRPVLALRMPNVS